MEPRILGWCPECGQEIPGWGTLIEYETQTGATSVFAECPSCSEVVHPAETRRGVPAE